MVGTWETYHVIDVTKKIGFPSHTEIHKLDLVRCILHCMALSAPFIHIVA
jgi:hypothetical protein